MLKFYERKNLIKAIKIIKNGESYINEVYASVVDRHQKDDLKEVDKLNIALFLEIIEDFKDQIAIKILTIKQLTGIEVQDD